ncbi:GspH/FimT family pseudopilin [Agrobacterium radiobacter]|uniref:Type II secretion system protein H n=1 Tax=Agrobacterium radiobacter TaxID=362 RepID=A0ABD5LPU1_AGRRD
MTNSSGMLFETSDAGFSLSEMLVVLGILGLLSSLAFPALHSLTMTTPASFAREIFYAAQFARLAAIKTGKSTDLIIDTNARFIQPSTKAKRIEVPREISFFAAVGRDEKTTVERGSITFFPDGGSTGGMIRFQRSGVRDVIVSVNWLTGIPTMMETSGNDIR